MCVCFLWDQVTGMEGGRPAILAAAAAATAEAEAGKRVEPEGHLNKT